MDILLQRNQAYCWYNEHEIYVKGYFQLKSNPGAVYREKDAVLYLSTATDFSAFLALLKAVDGVFAVVVQRENTIWAAVDRARSMPLYYAVDGSAISDDSEYLRAYLKIAKEQTDPLRMAELMTTGAVSDCYTVYERIKQLTIGTAVEWKNGQRQIAAYYRHLTHIQSYSREGAKAALRRTAKIVIRNILKVVNGRPIVLSLSGGYDSRFVACMLKECGVDQVSCYTYGNQSSFEVAQSKRVADALGYRWICVTYTDDDVEGQLDESGMAYINACFQHDFTTYLQNYIAVKKLHEEGWFPENAVFLTGLCHDMPTGAYQRGPEDMHYPISAEGVADYTMNSRFIRYQLREDARVAYLDDLLRQISDIGLEIRDFQDFTSVADALSTGFGHSRRFLPMNHCHEYFGYEWLLPCWNQELLDFWYSLPYTMRIRQNLYEEWLITDLCGKYGIGTKKRINRHFSHPWIETVARQVGGIVAWFSFKTHKTLRLHTDINGGATLRQRLYDEIQQKKAIKYSRAGQVLLLTLYLMEQRYGTQFWKSVRTVLKK